MLFRELLNCNWKNPDKEQLAPNVCRLIRRTNDVSVVVFISKHTLISTHEKQYELAITKKITKCFRHVCPMQMTSWVCTEILQRKTCSQRVMVIEHFVQIAYYCYKHNDLHCALNITIALGSACIRGLRQTWAEVDKKVSPVVDLGLHFAPPQRRGLVKLIRF